MCWVLDADINLGGGTIKAVGRHATGFQGTLYGNKHVIKNGTVQYETWIGGTTHYAVGLFHKVNGGKIYDVTLDSTLKCSMKTDIDANVIVHMGSLVACAYNATIVGVNSKVSFDNRQTGNNAAVLAKIGGIAGYASACKLVKTNYNGTIYFQGSATHLEGSDGTHIGGIVGCIDGANGTTTVIDQCSVTGTVQMQYNGPNIGGIAGRIMNTANIILKITNVVVNTQVIYNGSGGSPDLGLIYGWQSSVNLNTTNGTTVSNIYVTGGGTYCNSTTPSYYLATNHGTPSAATQFSNICLPVDAGTTVYPSTMSSSSAVQKKNDTAGVVSSANSNPAISNNYTLTNAGGITSNNVSSGHIAFIKGAGR